MVLGRTNVDADHLALTRGTNSDRDQNRHRDHPAVLSHLLEGGVQEEVWELAIQASGAEGMDLGVELFADPADLVLGDALDPERFGEVVDGSGRDVVDVGLLHNREQRSLVPAPRFQQARKAGPLPELGDLQLQGADPGVPLPVSIAVAVGRPTRRALVRLGADQVGHLGVHQLLRQQLNAVAKKVRIRALLRLDEQVQQCHPETRHRCGPPCGE
jgi:hypothetical protein